MSEVEEEGRVVDVGGEEDGDLDVEAVVEVVEGGLWAAVVLEAEEDVEDMVSVFGVRSLGEAGGRVGFGCKRQAVGMFWGVIET